MYCQSSQLLVELLLEHLPTLGRWQLLEHLQRPSA